MFVFKKIIKTMHKEKIKYLFNIFYHVFLSTMQSSRSGRKLNQAVQNTSKAVASTGKVVGMCWF